MVGRAPRPSGRPRNVRSTEEASPAPSGVAVVVDRVNHAFPDAAGRMNPVLNDVSMEIPSGSFVSIIGPSGCGKTTVLNLIAGLERLQNGRLTVLDAPPAAGRADVSVSFARDALLPWRTAVENVALPLELRGVSKQERETRAEEVLALVGLGDFRTAYRAQLSQGMRQRVALARALVQRPRLMLLDEPFAALDSQTRVVVQAELVRMLDAQSTPVTTLMVTHDLAEAVALSDVVVLMSHRPATIQQVFPIDLPRPRDAVALRTDDRFHELFDEIWAALSQMGLS